MSDFDFDEFDDDEFSEFEDNPFGDEDDQFSAFEMQVDSKMSQVLNSAVPRKERIDAIYWLGESGAPKAIPVLRRVYAEEYKKKKKKDNEIFQASEYALGQFKALDLAIQRGKNESVMDALANPENEHIMDLLQSIALGGVNTKSGGSSPVLPIILTVSLIILIGLNVVLGGGSGSSGASSTPVPTNISFSAEDAAAVDVLNQMDTLTQEMMSKIDTLQAYYTTFDCTPQVLPSISVSVPQDVADRYPNIANIGLRLDTTTTFLAQEITNRQGLCEAASTLEGDLLASAVNSVNSLETDLGFITTDLAAARSSIVASYGPPTATPIPTEGPSPTPSDTPTPTVSPTPTIAPSDIRPHTFALSDIVNNLDVSGGPIPLLEQYWSDLQSSGTTQACNGLVVPTMPENYDVGNAELLAYVPDLANAQEKVNFLLDNLRTGWSLLELACQSADPSTLVDPGVAAVGVVRTALADARAALLPLQQIR